MNVLLTNVKAPTTPTETRKADVNNNAGNKDFRSIVQEKLRSESDKKLQLVEESKTKGEATVDTGLSQMAQSSDEIAKSELLSNAVTPIPPKANSTMTGSLLLLVGENLPVNGNSLPLPADQVRSVGLMSNIRVKTLPQGGAAGDSTIFDTNSKSANPDLLDSLTTKTFELNALQQTASDSSNARLQAAMAAITGSQHPSGNPSVSNPAPANSLGSASVLSNNLVVTDPNSSVEWGSGLGERVSLMLNQKQNLATIRLDPPMLGKMDIQIQIKDDVTNVTINTQHAQTRDMVEGASQRLREFLQDAGYTNVNVDVSHQSDQQKNDAQFMADADSSDGLDSGLVSNEDDQLTTTQVTLSDSLVDYFA
jgi:flagellar hook-length control protein FliK